MFASNMKILTLNANNVSPTIQGGGGTQSITNELNNNGNGGSSVTLGSNYKSNNKREQKNNIKTKFIHGNNSKMLQHITQQHPQKYHHKNSNNNNGNKLKNQHYSNSNNSNSTSSLNRKKFYQQQQHHQQQHHYQQQLQQPQQQKCLTSMQQNINFTQTSTTNTNNNNSNLVKNQNYTNIDLLKQQQQQHRQQHQHPHNITNAVNSLVNHNTKLMETCTCQLQQNNCDKPSLSSCSSASSGSSSSTASSRLTATGQHQQLDAICYDNHLKDYLSSDPKISLSSAAQTTALTASACISCWTDFTKLPQQQQSPTSANLKSPNTSSNLQEFVASALVAAAAQASKCNSNLNLAKPTSSPTTSSTTTTTLTSSAGQLHLPSNTNSSFSVSKKKSFWKNSNTSRGGAGIEGGGAGGVAGVGNRGLSSSGYLLGSSNQSKEQQHHVSDKNLITNTSNNFAKNSNSNGNVHKYSSTLAANINTTQQKQISKNQVPAGEKMTTTLSATSGSTSVKTTVPSNNNTASASSSKTCTTSPKQQQGTLENHNDSKHMLKTLSNNNNSNSEINKTTATPSTSTPTSSSVPSSPNSYTLDFLHSVGVKMTGVALRTSGIQGSTNAYGNQSITSSPVPNSYPYTTGMTANQRQPRYMYGGSSTNNGNNASQQQHYHHHHQPSQLTIASFLHKDLLGGDHVLSNVNNASNSRGASSSSSNSRNMNNYSDQQQQQQHYAQPQPPNHTRYHHNYYATPYQQQSAVMQHTNYGGGGGYGGELARLVTNGSGGAPRNSAYAYTNYNNASGESAVGKNSTMAQRQLQNNVNYYKNSVNTSQANKKSYASSTTSTCSSSSLKSISSNSSNISNRPLQTAAQETNSISSNLNLAIETLPSKTLGGGNQRGNHRGHHHNHHGHHHNHHTHHHGNHHHQHSMMNSPNVLQHQNYYNLTYVTTDSSVSGSTSRGCSPAPQSRPPTPLSATNCKSPKSLENSPSHVAMLMNFNASHLQYPHYSHTQQQMAAQQQQQFHQFQQQQELFLNKKLLIPLTLNMPSPSPSPTPPPNTASISLNSQQTPPPSHNIICCSQLDEATTLAAAAAATSSSSSEIIAGNDYDSDTSSNHSSTQIKYHSLKSLKSSVSSSSSSSSSSSAFTTSMTGQQPQQQQNCSQPTTPATCGPTTLLHSPLDYNYSGVATQAFPNQQVTQQPQLSQFYGNSSGAVISLLNLPTKSPNGYAEEDYQQQQQQQQQHHQFYFNTSASQRSVDHLNIASALTAVANRSNSSTSYWSPTYNNNQFLYHQSSSSQVALMPPTTSSSSSCGSSSASISPRLPSDDMQQQNQQRLHNSGCLATSSLSSPCTSCLNDPFNNIIIGSSSNSDSGMLLAGSSCSSNSSSVSGCSNNASGLSINTTNGGHTYKRGSSQLLAQQQQRLIAQQTYQSSSSSTSSLSSSSASTLTSAVRARGGGGGESGFNTNNARSNQLPLLPQTTITSTVGSSSVSGVQQLPPTPTQHLYSLHQQQQQQQNQSLPPPLPPHNLLYNNPQTHHMRALSSSSINSSVHDFFTHTPPDRFLARAHLIEAKETPATLLNNSKWDHLSQGIWKKFINSQQTEETFKQKMHLWRYLYLFIKNAYPRYGLYLVGSTISGFGADSSDVDMCLVSRSASSIDPRMEALFNLTVLRDCLSKSGEFENFNLIEAKVPILRFCDRMHQLEVDLNFNNCVGIKNTHLLYCYSQLDWRLRPLVLVTKLWAQYHNINNAKNMTISSYSLVLMVIHFLQYAVTPPVLPCLHDIFPDKFPLLRSNDFGYVDMNETIGPYDSKNTQSVGELFLLFLEYYSCFDYTQFAISIRTGGLLPINVCRIAKSLKNDIHQWKELCIEEPFDLTNTARSVYDNETFERVKAVFVASWRVLRETLDLNSVFTTIMIPSPSSTERTNVLQNINQIITTSTNTGFSEIESDVDVTDTKISFEQYVKDFSVTTIAMENYDEHTKSSIDEDDDEEDSFINVDGDAIDEGNNSVTSINSSFVATSTTRRVAKRNDLNRTLTPRQIKVFAEKEFPLSPSSSSSGIKTSTTNANRSNNNSKTATPMIS